MAAPRPFTLSFGTHKVFQDLPQVEEERKHALSGILSSRKSAKHAWHERQKEEEQAHSFRVFGTTSRKVDVATSVVFIRLDASNEMLALSCLR